MPRVLGIAHQRARILLRKTRRIMKWKMKQSCANTVRVRYRKGEGLPKLQKETGRYREMDRDRCGGGYYYCSNVGRWSG